MQNDKELPRFASRLKKCDAKRSALDVSVTGSQR